MAHLTTTSYGVLGLLAIKPWSAYELTKQVRRSLSLCWPRAETRIYQEPKNLVAHGLVRAKVETNGRRSRTVYSITPAGRRALRKWLDRPSAPPIFESEGLLKVVFAEHGTKEGLTATLAQLEEQMIELRQQVAAQATEYATEVGPFPERMHVLALGAKFMFDYSAVVADWARWARAEVERWPAVGPAEAVPVAFEVFQAAMEAEDVPAAVPQPKAGVRSSRLALERAGKRATT